MLSNLRFSAFDLFVATDSACFSYVVCQDVEMSV
ncbi:hypothetical protein S2091_1208 [Solimicrobium silvestre]|uniref:Uncharacterized protein n=1 Tax=Solimicrobium silvestre TaxID=2099400 RepID=A0A2S9H222_9BURK|nr:hypothetical protein S2091_1208 [Solimicrobium silvestre]